MTVPVFQWPWRSTSFSGRFQFLRSRRNTYGPRSGNEEQSHGADFGMNNISTGHKRLPNLPLALPISGELENLRTYE
jgi:hypothetical protein